MTQISTLTNTNFPSLFRIAGGNSGLALPFTREISLLNCHIAGTNFRPDIADIEPDLPTGTTLRLQREPGNKHDPLAIALYTPQGYHLGYIPRAKNEVLASLLDAGKNLSAKLTHKEWDGAWLKLDIEIFLHD